jgi:phosphate transport system permease protein
VSGMTIALAISTGELAPLLFTAGFTDFDPSLNLFHHQVPYLTSVVFTDLSLPTPRAHATSAAAGLVTLVILLFLIFVGRLAARRAGRNTARMSL